ncbi:hypothetical protein CYMTET_33398 [Cymbomonas tetramitiformis]|uniref:Uncharacterized protein n=1 Tax=Cymbomonas tetramitiformis TaxID=36881 RepID=A0AAE0KR03_9CHLO|nr:hypothetical protein CYMTET_33398 [Cymbomonas tetramitiformis]
MRHIGVDIQDLAQHGSVHTPVRLTEIEDSDAFTLEVEKTQVDEARRCAESRTGTQQRRLPLYSWVTIAGNALESELTEFDPLGLQIWAAFSSSEAYLFRGMAAGNQPTPATVPARLGVNRFPSGVPSAAEYRSPGNSLPAAPGLLPVDQRLSQFPGHHDLMGAASPSDVYRESKTVADVLKLIRDIPMYPSSAELITTDADIAALPPFSEALVNFLSMGVVTFALGRMSAYRLDLTMITMPDLEGSGATQTTAAIPDFSQARSVLDDIALVGLAGTVMRMAQRREETARLFATRLVSWHEVVQLLADAMPNCHAISQQQLLYQFWSGLRLKQAVMDRLIEDRLDLQSPADWEGNHPGSTALQHIITVATKLERSEALTAARTSPASAPANRSPAWRNGRSSSRLNAVQDAGEEDATDLDPADLRVQHAVPPSPAGLTRPPRRCYVCNSDSHLWANCPDEAKKRAWIADAPAQWEDLEDEAEALEYFQNEESAAASSSGQQFAEEED